MTDAASPFGIFARSRRLLMILVAIAVLLIAFIKVQGAGLLQPLPAGFELPLLLAALVTFFHFLVEPARWYYYMFRGSKQQFPALYLKNFHVYATTALLSYSLPFKLGLPLRLYFFKRFFHLSTHQSIQIIGIDSLLTLSLWTLLSVPAACFVAPREFLQSWQLLAVIIVGAGLGVLLLRSEKLQNLLRGWRTPGWKSALPDSKGILILSALLCLDILFYGLRHQLIVAALLPDTPVHSVFLIGIVATFAGIASALPMGLGAYDITLVVLLSAVGIPAETALLTAGINRSMNIGISIVLGGFSSLRLSISSADLETNIGTKVRN